MNTILAIQQWNREKKKISHVTADRIFFIYINILWKQYNIKMWD